MNESARHRAHFTCQLTSKAIVLRVSNCCDAADRRIGLNKVRRMDCENCCDVSDRRGLSKASRSIDCELVVSIAATSSSSKIPRWNHRGPLIRALKGLYKL